MAVRSGSGQARSGSEAPSGLRAGSGPGDGRHGWRRFADGRSKRDARSMGPMVSLPSHRTGPQFDAQGIAFTASPLADPPPGLAGWMYLSMLGDKPKRRGPAVIMVTTVTPLIAVLVGRVLI